MICWHSGTGNSRYVAEQLAEQLRESLFKIADRDLNPFTYSDKSLGLVFPVYSWGVPPDVLDFIDSWDAKTVAKLRDSDVWMVCTCGDETGRAPEMLNEHLNRKGITLKGRWSVIMPNNYVLLPGFDVDAPEVAAEKLRNVPTRIGEIGRLIAAHQWKIDCLEGSWASLKTRLIYPIFRRWGVSVKKWHTTDACISCGRCAEVCISRNIMLIDGTPRWGDNCFSCCACYHICPVNAVQYGTITKHKGQYFFPKSC